MQNDRPSKSTLTGSRTEPSVCLTIQRCLFPRFPSFPPAPVALAEHRQGIVMPLSHAVLVLGLLLAQPEPAPPRDAAAKQELQRLQGTWKVEAMEEDGAKTAAGDLKGRIVFFGKDTFLLKRDNMLQIG